MMGRGLQQRKLLAAVIGERHRNAVFQRGNREIGGLVPDDCTVALERERVGVELLERIYQLGPAVEQQLVFVRSGCLPAQSYGAAGFRHVARLTPSGFPPLHQPRPMLLQYPTQAGALSHCQRIDRRTQVIRDIRMSACRLRRGPRRRCLTRRFTTPGGGRATASAEPGLRRCSSFHRIFHDGQHAGTW